eukprot:CAMPEP_0181138512 /NCGR_PEP_ID=MMETSP1071-20121207/34288_1 /TAXON_ID=35127 /ORGANISM="Thalassiosira sp., Strain NH16" /LENGTH=163 /DNA_ID=CAMNT_0023225357 /DNA_START=626 /DNA_END=1114 /DNA_ORIENTATION=+
MTANIHARHARNLPYPSPQLLIARRHDEAPPLRHHIHEAVVGITPLATARDALEPRILRHAQCHLVLRPEPLELPHDAVGDARYALREEAVHHGPYDVHLVPDGKVDEVGIHEDVVGRSELGVVLEEEGGYGLVDVAGLLLLLGLLRLRGLYDLVGFDARILW